MGRGYPDYVDYSGGSCRDLYQVGPNTRFHIMNAAQNRYLHTDAPYTRWLEKPPSYHFTWKTEDTYAGSSCELVKSNRYGTGRRGELVELWDGRDLQIGSASNSHNVLCYPH